MSKELFDVLVVWIFLMCLGGASFCMWYSKRLRTRHLKRFMRNDLSLLYVGNTLSSWAVTLSLIAVVCSIYFMSQGVL